jgi:prolyl oligopeptidase
MRRTAALRQDSILPRGRTQITKRLAELMKVDSFDPPIERNGSYFFRKRRSDQDLSGIYKRTGIQGSDEVLVDPHPMSTDHSTSVNLLDVSHDGSLAAYNIRAGGQDEVTVHFFDTQSRKELPDQLPKANYFALTIQPDNHCVYYARTTANGPRVYHHVMGLAATKDLEIFGKGYGPDKLIVTNLSEDGRYLLIDLIYGTGSTRSKVYFQDVQNGGSVKPIVNDLDSVFYGEIEGGALFLSTNWRAPHWHVFRADLQNPVRNAWKEIVPETDTAIDSIGLFGRKIFVQYVRNATSQVKMFDTDGKPAGEIALPALGTVTETTGAWSLQ